MDRKDLTSLTADVVSAYVSNNQVDTGSLSDLILTVHKTLAQTEQPSELERKSHKPSVSISGPSAPISEPSAPLTPSVPIRMSVSAHSITCLECGAEMKMLKMHLSKAHKLTPNEYKLRWNLEDDYPLVASAYSEKRRAIANNIGLGHMRLSDA